MKFGITKLPQSYYYKDTEKNFERKKSNKDLSLIDDRKVNANLFHDKKIFFYFSNLVLLLPGSQGALAPTLVY